MHVRTGRWEIEHHEAVPGPEGCFATRFDSVCNVCFTALPFSEGPTIGTLVLES
jgi:hypothetical protein